MSRRGRGVYRLKEELRLPGAAPGPAPRFVVTGEISSIYKRGGKTRKVHNVILLPSLEAADELSARLEAIETSAPTAGLFLAWTAGIC